MARLKMWKNESLFQSIKDIDKQLLEIPETNETWSNYLKAYQQEMKDELKRRETLTQESQS